jgi:hypothetical protein
MPSCGAPQVQGILVASCSRVPDAGKWLAGSTKSYPALQMAPTKDILCSHSEGDRPIRLFALGSPFYLWA